MKAALVVLLLVFTNQALAECMANGVRKGSKIPSYWFMSKEPLDEYWEKYVNTKTSSFKLEYGDPEDIKQLCLANIAYEVNRNLIDFQNSEKVIVKKSCSDINVGEKQRMFIGHYCIEFIENFFMFLPYRHATVTNKRRH